MLLGLLGALILAGVIGFGIPAIRLAFNTVSTHDAYVNGEVTFVAARVRGQVSRVLVDDNNRVRQGDLLVELDKEPYQTAVSVNIIERPKSGALKIAIPAFQPLAAPTMSQTKVHL